MALNHLVNHSQQIEWVASPEVQEWIRRVSARIEPVLITGESGTGKELVARAIHQLGSAAGLPFVTADCEIFADGSLDRALLESAGGGTLFLHEIGELRPEGQAQVFRVLQEGLVRHPDTHLPILFQARILAATRMNMDLALLEGRFRPELYYRLNVHSIVLDPLRERLADLPALIGHFLKLHSERGEVTLSSPAQIKMEMYAWPGNLRELENCIVTMLTRGDGPVLDVEHLPPALQQLQLVADSEVRLRSPLRKAERDALMQVLRQTGGQVGEAAARLGVSQATLYRKLAMYGLKSTNFRA